MNISQLSYVSSLATVALYLSDEDTDFAEQMLKVWDRDGVLTDSQFKIVKRLVDLNME